MNILKSILVLIALSMLVVISFKTTKHLIHNIRSNRRYIKSIICTVIVSILTVYAILSYGIYIYPFEKNVELVLVKEYTLPKQDNYEILYGKKWCGVYKADGSKPASFIFKPEKYDYDFENLEFDLDNYTYIVTYAQKAESLSYNVWDTIKKPVNTGAKEGHIVFKEEYNERKVYIYKIKDNIRIDCNMNDLSNLQLYNAK
ncbi:MAG: hypothetical protein E7591_02660 [Ruminococcaceae bacterium]|nr:hypothetical protein [Oscillospiraceae bacterium]